MKIKQKAKKFFLVIRSRVFRIYPLGFSTLFREAPGFEPRDGWPTDRCAVQWTTKLSD